MEMNKIKCPVCRNSLLFRVEESLKCGIVEGKCCWCNSTSTFNSDNKEIKVTEIGAKAQKMKERIKTNK